MPNYELDLSCEYYDIDISSSSMYLVSFHFWSDHGSPQYPLPPLAEFLHLPTQPPSVPLSIHKTASGPCLSLFLYPVQIKFSKPPFFIMCPKIAYVLVASSMGILRLLPQKHISVTNVLLLIFAEIFQHLLLYLEIDVKQQFSTLYFNIFLFPSIFLVFRMHLSLIQCANPVLECIFR